jgi:hypothetical protein
MLVFFLDFVLKAETSGYNAIYQKKKKIIR